MEPQFALLPQAQVTSSRTVGLSRREAALHCCALMAISRNLTTALSKSAGRRLANFAQIARAVATDEPFKCFDAAVRLPTHRAPGPKRSHSTDRPPSLALPSSANSAVRAMSIMQVRRMSDSDAINPHKPLIPGSLWCLSMFAASRTRLIRLSGRLLSMPVIPPRNLSGSHAPVMHLQCMTSACPVHIALAGGSWKWKW